MHARTFGYDIDALSANRARIDSGDRSLTPALDRLHRDLAEALVAGPFSVMDKEAIPPSGDKHDYMSTGPYWWPDPHSSDGLPYVRRDGETNPDRDRGDNVALAKMSAAVETLALAWYLLRDPACAVRAARLLRAWFFDDQTRMNPDLEYAQAIPGLCDGRGIGIIDTAPLVRLIDAVGMLADSNTWTRADQHELQAWFVAYGDWLVHSDYGRDEFRMENNHGTWYDVQAAIYALFTSQPRLARRLLATAVSLRIAEAINPDGSQPHELKRTRALGYATFNLEGLFALAGLGEHVGMDLWHFATPDGRSIRAALDWLIPYGVDRRPWPYEQISEFDCSRWVPLLRRAAIQFDAATYEPILARLPVAEIAAHRANLLFPPAG